MYKSVIDEKGKTKYRTLGNKINKKANQDKEEFVTEICNNNNNRMRKGQIDAMKKCYIRWRIYNGTVDKVLRNFEQWCQLELDDRRVGRHRTRKFRTLCNGTRIHKSTTRT